MAQPSASLGISSSFDATQFRNSIKFAMQMGAPNEASRKAAFIFKPTGRTYKKNGTVIATPRLDSAGSPLDPEVEVIDAAETKVSVDCAIEVVPATQEELPVGKFRPTKALVTLLDVDYAKVKGCKELRYNNDRFAFGFEHEGNGLFGVSVYSLTFYAVDDK